jgi:ABC-2 type transport system ATP-binding protein
MISMNAVVDVQNLLVKYEEFTAVNDVSFRVGSGEIRGVLGGNGAGKSTTLRVLGGVIRPTLGTISIGGVNIRSFKGMNQARSLTGYCPDVGGLISGATPLEHLRILASLHREKNMYTRGLEQVERFNLGEFKNTPVSGFSHGMMRRLSVLLAFVSAKSLLILDEPFDGVDPLGVEIINAAIQDAKNDGMAVLVSTHLQNLLVDISDSVNIMSRGELLDTIPASELVGEAGVQKYTDMLVAHKDNA